MLKDKFGFNFWPSFTDLMLSFTLVVLMVFGLFLLMTARSQANIQEAKHNEQYVATAIEGGFEKLGKTVYVNRDDNLSVATVLERHKANIYVLQSLTTQTIMFSDNVLFDSDEAFLKPEGALALSVISPIIKDNLDKIAEIHIQGHTDYTSDDNHNLRLGAERAMSVYNFLVANGVDPARCLMSVSSFGKYKPVGRDGGEAYRINDWENPNDPNIEVKKERNRRIEIVLIYKKGFELAKKSQ